MSLSASPALATAQNTPNSRDQQIDCQSLVGTTMGVHVIPSREITTREVPLLATAQNSCISLAQHTEVQLLLKLVVSMLVQVVPLLLTAILLFPLFATVQNFITSGAQQIETQLLVNVISPLNEYVILTLPYGKLTISLLFVLLLPTRQNLPISAE